MMQEDHAYHSERALRELHLGLTSSSVAAARAHLQLSSLHMKKVCDAAGPAGRRRPLFIID
ncbi:hypothetical protein [Sphingosinicella terrae]|uniref:hypothetical protein n=1 Tax=Sphingosinicella terrae TaxID=2172047 RepID=UPI000E0D8819|nr:hypothetical protein [Sphingosinicella terrae]